MELQYELVGVSKKYGPTEVLKDFNLKIEQGDMLAITGPSGSGKSTVLNLLGLIDSPNSGAIRILGVPAPKPHTAVANRYIRKHIGYLFQNYALIDDATVRKNLEIALFYSHKRQSRGQSISTALNHVELSGTENRRIYSLSGGEQQRIAIARLLLKPCDIVLADEPTGSLDDDNRDIVISLLHGLRDLGKTVVIATHDNAVAATCARQIALPQRRVI